MTRFGCETLSQLQDRVLHEPTVFPALLDYLTVQVSEMFRDPAYFRSLRETVVPLLRTYPSLKVWVAGCSTGEEVYSLAILLREEGLLERTLIYATDINPQALQKAEAGVYDLDRIAGFTENHRKSGARSSLSDYYTAAYGRAVFDKSLKQHIVFSDHSLATDSVFAEVQLVSCRNVLIYFDRELQDRALGLFRDALCRKGFLGIGAKESLRFSAHADAFAELVARRSHLPEARTTHDAAAMSARAASTPSSSARRPAASRRCRCCCRRCRPDCGAPVFVVLHLPRERPSLLVEIFAPQVRGAGARGRGQGAGRAPARSTSRRPTITCSSTTGPQLALSADEPVHFSRPSIDVLFESAADVVRRPAARHRSSPARTRTARGPGGGARAPAACDGRPGARRRRSAPLMVESALKRMPGGPRAALEEIAELLGHARRPDAA